MHDPQIPRGPMRPVPGPTWGRFVDFGDRVVLTDRAGNRWAPEVVSILSGSFGNADEGVEKLPRPWKFGKSGEVIVNGDWVVIDFLDGSSLRPFVRGGIRPLPHDAFLARSHADIEAGESKGRLRARLRPRDTDGNPTGEARLKVANDGTGRIEIMATDAIVIEVGSDLDKDVFVSVTIDRDIVTVRKSGTATKLVVEALLGDLLSGLTELMAFANGLGVPTPNLLTLINKLPTRYRTSILKAE